MNSILFMIGLVIGNFIYAYFSKYTTFAKAADRSFSQAIAVILLVVLGYAS